MTQQNNQPDHLFISDLTHEAPTPIRDSIVSRNIFKEHGADVTLFRFAAGQELSTHTAAFPAFIQVLEGEAQMTLGEEKITAKSGSWIYMAPHLPHSLNAVTQFSMVLTLLK